MPVQTGTSDRYILIKASSTLFLIKQTARLMTVFFYGHYLNLRKLSYTIAAGNILLAE